MTFDGDMNCSDCYYTAGGGNKSLKTKNSEQLVCVCTYPAIIKIAALLCDFIADNLCHELSAHLINIEVNYKHDSDEIECMRQSVITLTSVALTSRGENHQNR